MDVLAEIYIKYFHNFNLNLSVLIALKTLVRNSFVALSVLQFNKVTIDVIYIDKSKKMFGILQYLGKWFSVIIRIFVSYLVLLLLFIFLLWSQQKFELMQLNKFKNINFAVP